MDRGSLITPCAEEMDVSELTEAVNSMIAWYQTKRSNLLALSIAEYIEQLACLEEPGASSSNVCDYKRWADAWRYLASKR